MDVKEDINFYLNKETVKTHELCATIILFNIKRKGFRDITGAFPQKSSIRNLYVMVMYDYASSAFLAVPIKNRQAATICDDFLKIHKILKLRGSDPKLYIMDNECSRDLKQAMKKHTIDFQLAPPHIHRKNATERGIRTCKNHFISGLSTIDPYFPPAHHY